MHSSNMSLLSKKKLMAPTLAYRLTLMEIFARKTGALICLFRGRANGKNLENGWFQEQTPYSITLRTATSFLGNGAMHGTRCLTIGCLIGSWLSIFTIKKLQDSFHATGVMLFYRKRQLLRCRPSHAVTSRFGIFPSCCRSQNLALSLRKAFISGMIEANNWCNELNWFALLLSNPSKGTGRTQKSYPTDCCKRFIRDTIGTSRLPNLLRTLIHPS